MSRLSLRLLPKSPSSFSSPVPYPSPSIPKRHASTITSRTSPTHHTNFATSSARSLFTRHSTSVTSSHSRAYSTRQPSFSSSQSSSRRRNTAPLASAIRPTISSPARTHPHALPSVYTITKRFDTEYQRPFSTFKGVLDAMLIGSRHNYVRPSVTYAAGLGNTALRSIRLHPEDYQHAVPAHLALPAYIKQVIHHRRPPWWLSLLFLLSLTAMWDRRRRENEVYDQAVDSIFAYKSRNFLIKLGERVFLETLLIMFFEGVVEPLEIPGESPGLRDARFLGEIHSMIAEIERHRDYRLSNIPLNVFEVLDEQERAPFRYRLSRWLQQPWAIPFHRLWSNQQEMGTEFDTPGDIERIQRGDLHVDMHAMGIEGRPFDQLDSSGIGSIYGLLYPLLTRYHHTPVQLTVQGVPQSFQRDIRRNVAPFSKLVGRIQDRAFASTLFDQFQPKFRGVHSRNPNDIITDNEVDEAVRSELPQYWDSDVPTELYNSYYMQRAMNLVKRVHDVDTAVLSTYEGENSLFALVKNWMSKPYHVLLENSFRAKIYNFEPGDTPIFRHYYRKYNLVPYLNALQYEMHELLLLRQRVSRLGVAVGVDDLAEGHSIAGVSGLRADVLDLLDTAQLARSHRLMVLHEQQRQNSYRGGVDAITSDKPLAQFDKSSFNSMTIRDDHGIIAQSTTSERFGDEALAQQTRAELLGGNDDKGITPLSVAAQIAAPAEAARNPSPSLSNPRAVDFVPGASHTFESTSLTALDAIELDDSHSNTRSARNKYIPSLPVPHSPSTLGLYQPVKTEHVAEFLINQQYHIKGTTILAESLALAQNTARPTLFPGYTDHPQPIQERLYTRGLFAPQDNARGETSDQRYIHGLLGALDVILLRDVHEYQRWLPMVPDHSKTVWDSVQQFLQRHNLGMFVSAPGGKHEMPSRENNFIARASLPEILYKGYQGLWSPFTSRHDRPHYTKPEYVQTPPVESWAEMFMRLMGSRESFFESRGEDIFDPQYAELSAKAAKQITPYDLPPGQYMLPPAPARNLNANQQLGEPIREVPSTKSGI